jgi:hypothetical protein
LRYIANALQFSKTSFAKWFKPLSGGLLVAIVLLLNAMAAWPALHEFFHADADKADHQCAVTLFAHGQMDAADVAVAAIVPPVFAEYCTIPVTLIFSSAVEILPHGRAPPSATSPLV